MNEDNVRGPFSREEERFLRDNYLHMTDDQMAASLHRTVKSVINKRMKLKLGKQQQDIQADPHLRATFISTLDESSRREMLRKELKASSHYKQIKSILTKTEIEFYEDKYLDFMCDPTIETMTAPERDTLHEMILAQVRHHRLMEQEKECGDEEKGIDGGRLSRDIQMCEDTIKKCRESLNVERRQRTKNQADTAVTFAGIIKELKQSAIRQEAGYEAAMLKFIAEKWYNDKLNKNVFSGNNNPFDLSIIFRGGEIPSGIASDFTPTCDNG